MRNYNPRNLSGITLHRDTYLRALAVETMRWCPRMDEGGWDFSVEVTCIVERDRDRTLPMVPAVKASVRKPPAVASVEWTVARYEAADERRRLMG